MTGVVLAIYSSFFLALSQASLKKSFKELEPSVGFFFDALFAILIWVPLTILFGVHVSALPQVFIYALLSGILAEALVFYALSKGQLSITAILIGSYPIYTILFSYIINHERLTSTELMFVCVTIIGTLITYLPSKLSFTELKKSGAILWPIIAAIGIGLSDTLSKRMIDQHGDATFLFTLAVVQIPIAYIYLKLEKQKIVPQFHMMKENLSSFKNALAGSLFNIIGTGLLFTSFAKTLASLASPIAATSGALVVLIATLFFDEEMNLRVMIGLLLVFFGIIAISVQI